MTCSKPKYILIHRPDRITVQPIPRTAQYGGNLMKNHGNNLAQLIMQEGSLALNANSPHALTILQMHH